jgi:hypothetical protein
LEETRVAARFEGVDFDAEDGEEVAPRPCPQCGEVDCMEDTHDG